MYHRYSDLQATLTELQAFYKQRETKSDATIQQQTKLIDYLQNRIEDANKKKKVCISIDIIKHKY
jgi:citron Rho-interacting kinase